MEVRPFVLWGALDIETLRAHAEAVVDRWAKSWLRISEDAIAIDIAANDELERLRNVRPWRYLARSDGAGVAVAVPDPFPGRIVQWLYKDAAETQNRSSPAVSELARRMIDDLAHAFLEDGGEGEHGEISERALDRERLFAPGCGSIGIEIGLFQDRLTLVMNHAAATPLAAHRDQRRFPKAKLAPFREALRAEPLRLEARLGDVELTLKNLQTLAIGDVLRLDVKLEHTVSLSLDSPGSADARSLLHGYLGGHKGRKAIRLASH